MKWLILNTDYLEFVDDMYASRQGLSEASYDEQLKARFHTLFGTADFYSRNLRALGEEAWDLLANNEPLQMAWAREHGVKLGPGSWFGLKRTKARDWMRKILAAQIEFYQPDVVVNLSMDGLLPKILAPLKKRIRLLVGQHAAMSLDDRAEWSIYDLCLSSFPATIEWFRRRGLRAELFRLGFESEVAREVRAQERDIPVAFIGSIGMDVHRSRTEFLARVSREIPLKIWGMATPNAIEEAGLQHAYQGKAWGRQMFEILARSRVVLNHHGDVPAFANNLRLFEATGMGTALVTDDKPNLPEIFALDREVMSYGDEKDCIAKTVYLLNHEPQRAALARAGQERTLREHTFRQRMKQLIDLAGPLLK